MKNPSYAQCLKHLAAGGMVVIEDHQDEPEVLNSDRFLEEYDNSEDFDNERQFVQFLLK